MYRCLLSFLGVLLLMSSVQAKSDFDWDPEKYFFRIVHVTPDGTGDGRSWDEAISLQRLVDQAKDEGAILNPDSLVPCDQLWLSGGVHRLNKRLYANKDFHVSILGGFAGHETSADQRNPEANPTTVELDDCQFLFTRWADHLTVDGLTIRGGSADFGGGIHIAGSFGGGRTVLIRNVDFVDCSATRGGGAIYVREASGKPTAPAKETRNLRIVDCRFVGCSSGGAGNREGGGAICINKTSPVDIDGVLVRGCEFTGNRAATPPERDRGGAAVLVRAPHLRLRPVCIEYCLFEDNRSTNASGEVVGAPGDAIDAEADYLVVKDCEFVGSPGDLRTRGSGQHKILNNRFVASRAEARDIPPESERGPVWAGIPDPGDAHWRDRIVTEKQRDLGCVEGAQYELYQPSISYSVIDKGATPPHHGLYQHCAALAWFEGKFYVVWQSNPTVRIEWARGRKIYLATSEDFETWTAPELIAPDLPHLGGTQPMLMTAPNGELWCIWSCSARDPEIRGMQMSVLKPGATKWVHRRVFRDERLDREHALYPQLNPWVLSSGRIIAPYIARSGKEKLGVFAYTDDDGETWGLSSFMRGPEVEGERMIWEIHGSEQIDGTIRVFGRYWGQEDHVLLTSTGSGIAKGSPLVFEEEARFAGVQAYQNRPFVMPLRGRRYGLLCPDAYAETLPARPASLYFSRSGGNDYVAGPSLAPLGAPCNYPQGIEHDGGIYIAFTDEMHDDGRDMRGVKVSPSPSPDRFYLWPRRRDLGAYVFSEPPVSAEVDGRKCVRFEGTGTAGVDTLPVDLSGAGRLEVRFRIKVEQADPAAECVLLSFGDVAPGLMPVRIGGPSLAQGILGVSTGTDWQDAVDFAPGLWHTVSAEFSASGLVLRVDDAAPRSFAVSADAMNPRLYLGEGLVVGEASTQSRFRFAVDLASLRTEVSPPNASRSRP